MENKPPMTDEECKRLGYLIFTYYKVGELVAVKGLTAVPNLYKVDSCGEIVLSEIRKLDQAQNCGPNGRTGKIRRKRHYIENSIGGAIAQKIFKWKKTEEDGVPVYSIWRYQ